MIQVIAWSKNRASQLDLTLSSIKKYFVDWKSVKINIIYTHTDEKYKKGYDLIQQYHPNFNYIKETNFRQDTLNLINNTNLNYISFFVDDDVFIDYFSLQDDEMKEFFNNKEICTISPRLAPYIDYCYTQNKPAQKPILNEKNIWNWRTNCSGDWNYPPSVASFHVFRKNDIISINNYPFKAPNTFEGALCNIPFTNQDYMICYKHAKCICSAPNKVQTENMNRNENSHSLEALNNEFLLGKRLDENVNNLLKLRTCHGPITLRWK